MSPPTGVRPITQLDLEAVHDPAARVAFRQLNSRLVAREEDAEMSIAVEREKTLLLLRAVRQADTTHDALVTSHNRMGAEVKASSAARRRDSRWVVGALRGVNDRLDALTEHVSAGLAHAVATGARHERLLTGRNVARGGIVGVGALVVTSAAPVLGDAIRFWLHSKGWL